MPIETLLALSLSFIGEAADDLADGRITPDEVGEKLDDVADVLRLVADTALVTRSAPAVRIGMRAVAAACDSVHDDLAALYQAKGNDDDDDDTAAAPSVVSPAPSVV